MKLGTKIILGFAFINLIFICLVGVIYFFLRPVSVDTANLSAYTLPLYTASTDIEYNMSQEYIGWRSFMASPTNDMSFVDTAKARSADVFKAIGDIDAMLKTPGGRVINIPEVTGPFQALASNYNRYEEMVALVPDRQNTLLDNRRKLVAVSDEIIPLMTEMMAIEVKSAEEDADNFVGADALKRRIDLIRLVAAARSTYYESYVLLVRGLLNSMPDLFTQSQERVERCEAMITDLLQRTQRDDVRQRITTLQEKMKQYSDMVTVVAKATADSTTAGNERTIFLNNVTNAADQLGQISQKMAIDVADNSGRAVNRLTLIMTFGSLAALVVSAFLSFFISRSITGPVNHLIVTLSEGAEEVDSASSQLSAASDTLSSGATENAAALEQTSAALEELSSMTNRNSDNAHEANALMGQANQSVRKADESMSGVIRAMDEIAESGNAISKIIKTIDEIAFQTNLLALNAAVEAARAGEAGSGFAVVADEVRNLAIRSAEAAKNTADLIAATINNISSGSEMVRTTADNFKAVESLSEKVAELLAEVSEASKEQTQGIGQITTAVMEMDKVTQANAASAEESASAAGQLSNQAGHLLSAVEDLTELVRGTRDRIGRSPSSKPMAVAAKKTAELPATRSLPASKVKSNDDDFEF